jgi:hypothetical protein
LPGGGEKDEEVLQDTYDTGFAYRYLRYSQVVVVYFINKVSCLEEVKKMKKFYRILMILGSLIGICATVRW